MKRTTKATTYIYILARYTKVVTQALMILREEFGRGSGPRTTAAMVADMRREWSQGMTPHLHGLPVQFKKQIRGKFGAIVASFEQSHRVYIHAYAINSETFNPVDQGPKLLASDEKLVSSNLWMVTEMIWEWLECENLAQDKSATASTLPSITSVVK